MVRTLFSIPSATRTIAKAILNLNASVTRPKAQDSRHFRKQPTTSTQRFQFQAALQQPSQQQQLDCRAAKDQRSVV